MEKALENLYMTHGNSCPHGPICQTTKISGGGSTVCTNRSHARRFAVAPRVSPWKARSVAPRCRRSWRSKVNRARQNPPAMFQEGRPRRLWGPPAKVNTDFSVGRFKVTTAAPINTGYRYGTFAVEGVARRCFPRPLFCAMPWETCLPQLRAI